MKKTLFFIFTLLVLGAIIYLTFIIALLKITIGLILLAVAAVILSVIYVKIKHRLND